MMGDIMKVETTGASAKTAMQDKLSETGVAASHRMAQTDSSRMQSYKCEIQQAAGEHKVDPAVIAAIISRESRAGAALKNGLGDHGNGFGLMQIDKRHHTTRGEWNSKEHISQGSEILVIMITRVKAKFPTWTAEQHLKGGIAAYNCGSGNIRSYESVDSSTTGRDYSNDVVARAQWYKRNW